jgi:hypothetical protein
MTAYSVADLPIWKRLVFGVGTAFLFVAIMIWIPVVGWIALIFTPVVFLYPLFGMRQVRRGQCPYCGINVEHYTSARSFKCRSCKQRVIITETEFHHANDRIESPAAVDQGAINAIAFPLSTADEIRKLKALVDEGILTGSEFEVKKKQLLG